MLLQTAKALIRDIRPFGIGRTWDPVILRIHPDREQSVKETELLWLGLHGMVQPTWKRVLYGQDPIAWEVLATNDNISFNVWVPKRWKEFVTQKIYRAYPTAEVSEIEGDYTDFDPKRTYMASLSLAKSHALSLKTDPDNTPLPGILASLAGLESDEKVLLQTVLRPIEHTGWQNAAQQVLAGIQAGEKAVTRKTLKDGIGVVAEALLDLPMRIFGSIPSTAPAVAPPDLKLSKKKIVMPGFQATIRLASQGKTMAAAELRAAQVTQSLRELDADNQILATPPLFRDTFLNELVLRKGPLVKVNGRVLVSAEVTQWARLPAWDLTLEKVAWLDVKQQPIPEVFMQPEGLPFGTANYRNKTTTVYMSTKASNWDFLSRVLVNIGATRAGKTTNWGERRFIEAAKAGLGAVFFDVADGNSITNLLAQIPPEREKDIILLDYTDTQHPPGIPTAMHSNASEYAVEDMAEAWVDLFNTYYGAGEQWRSQHVVRMAALAVFEDPEASYLELINMLTNVEYRNEAIGKIKNKRVLAEWLKLQRMSDLEHQIAPVTRKLGNIMYRSRIRNILCQRPRMGEDGQPLLNYRRWADQSKLVLVNVSGSMGEEHQRLIMTMNMMALWAAALSRDDLPLEKRVPFLVFLDEPQTYLSKNRDLLDNFISKSAKYRFALHLLFQSLAQVKKESPELLRILLANKPHLVMGFSDKEEGKEFAGTLAPFKPGDLETLPNYHFVCALRTKSDQPVQPFISKGLGPAPTVPGRNVTALAQLLRRSYGRPVGEIVADIDKRTGFGGENESVDVQAGGSFQWTAK